MSVSFRSYGGENRLLLTYNINFDNKYQMFKLSNAILAMHFWYENIYTL